MAGKAIWKGFIHFGEFSVPVKLHTAVREQGIQFHLLHETDRVRLAQKMICAYEKLPVPREEQVKGFEVEEGKYVIVDPEELEHADPEVSRAIEVHEFVKAGWIDPIFVDRTYYLGPDASTGQYKALAGAMGETGVEGVCTWAMRKRSYFGALKVEGKVLRLQTLRYADEVMAIGALELPDIAVSQKELEIGAELIGKLTVPFEPAKFQNEHLKKVQELIEKKVRGEEIAIRRVRRVKPTESDKLLQALEASLKKVA
ncbi:MAG TPA: Ku protein [Syntrophorhabdaceae bacterium]|jgi:DNA end-binding protein Ku